MAERELAIEILPKADKHALGSDRVWRDGLLEMLRVALGLRLALLRAASQETGRVPLLDLVAQAYLAELEPLLRAGLAKGYRSAEANGSVFRGRLSMAKHLRENLVRADRFYVEYQAFDHDILANRILAAALGALSWFPLSPSVAARVEACASQFPSVTAAEASVAMFERFRLTRATKRYKGALTYARMILTQHSPQLRSGAQAVFALLFDMNILWERYIATLLRRAAPSGVIVNAQESHAFWRPDGRPVRKVRPDIVVRSASGEILLVIDTKWKVPSGLPSDEDLKQMFVYNELLGSARSVLLYPRTATTTVAIGSYAAGEHRCEQQHIGLLANERWSSTTIKEQLIALVK